MFKSWPLKDHVAAISCGIYSDVPVLDLDYAEDSDRRNRRQFRHDRDGRHRRDPGHGGGRALLRGAICSSCWRWPRRASANWWSCSARRLRDAQAERRATRDRHPQQGQARGVRELLAPYGVRRSRRANLALPSPRRRSTPSSAMPASRRMAAMQATGMIALSDDSGLCVDALTARPASTRPTGPVPTADWSRAMRLVEEKLQAAAPRRRTSAAPNSSARSASSGPMARNAVRGPCAGPARLAAARPAWPWL